TRQPYPSSCGISFSLRELRRVNNALICHPIPPSPTFSYSSDFDRQVAEFQIRVAVLNGYTALGIPVTKVAG
ncbi:MAG: hypothetical protein ACK4RN_17985, partial [Pseudorhodobacter sp.]